MLFSAGRTVSNKKNENEDKKDIKVDEQYRDSYGNPGYQEIVDYIIESCNKIGLPPDIGLAIAWTESEMEQFVAKGKTKQGVNKNKKGEVTSIDWGIMQINDKSWSGEFDFNKIETDWKYCIESGLTVALNRYKKAMNQLQKFHRKQQNSHQKRVIQKKR